MKIVVTGGSGFIGLPLLRQMVASGHEVLAISRGANPEFTHSGITWVCADLGHTEELRGAVRAFRPEACIHLAWEGIPDFSLPMTMRNVEGSLRFCAMLIAEGCKHIVVSGSCWEYGKVRGLIAENTDPATPSVFGAGKRGLYLMLEAYCRQEQASLAWGRVFYPYGPRQKAASLVPTLCQAVLKGEVPSLRTPSAINDFIYVDDTASALLVLAEKRAEGIFNIGTGIGTMVGTMADELLSLAGRSAAYAQSISPDEAAGFWADMRRLNALGWEPKTSIHEGLRTTFESFRNAC